MGAVMGWPEKGDVLYVRRNAIVYRYGDVPGDRFRVTSRPNHHRRRITVNWVTDGYWHDGQTDPGPWVHWAGASGYWHWCRLSDTEGER